MEKFAFHRGNSGIVYKEIPGDLKDSSQRLDLRESGAFENLRFSDLYKLLLLGSSLLKKINNFCQRGKVTI